MSVVRSLTVRDRLEQDHVARVRLGDGAAFEALFGEYYIPLCTFVDSYVHERAVAEDLVQDLFCALWRRREGWTPLGGVRGYLFAAARHRALSHLRHEEVVERATTRCREAGLSPALGTAGVDGALAAETSQIGSAYRCAVQRLPERTRVAVTLRWEHGMSHAEIARVLGVSVKGVEAQMGRALRHLRVAMAAFRP